MKLPKKKLSQVILETMKRHTKIYNPDKFEANPMIRNLLKRKSKRDVQQKTEQIYKEAFNG